ncbi:flavodoxin family protein [Sporomusa aerivorans]|uniref:flavodoxin family protein n=1 Tax=Sporomusa aerivorans TaxID=204936 RepID=UPI00352A873E
MKVLGLVASPRRAGNSDIIVQEMMNMLPQEWKKEIIRLSDLRIDSCTACYACLPKDKQCVIGDDLTFLLDHIKAADKVIIAAPVYSLGQHTTIKLINDRMISILSKGDEYFTGKQCVIVISHGVKDWEGYAREATMHFARFFGLNVTGVLVVQAALPGDVLNPEIMGKMDALAQSLVDNTPVDFTDPELVYCPECGSSMLQVSRKGKWRCVMCASEGEWTNDTGEFTLSRMPQAHRRFTLEGITAHGCVLTGIKEQFLQRKAQAVEIRKKYRKGSFWIKPDSSQ